MAECVQKNAKEKMKNLFTDEGRDELPSRTFRLLFKLMLLFYVFAYLHIWKKESIMSPSCSFIVLHCQTHLDQIKKNGLPGPKTAQF